MRNLKKFLALVMAMLMIFSMAAITTWAADDADSDYIEAAQHLAALSIMKGDEHGNLNLANGVTRYQAALFFVQALTGRTDVNTWNAEKKSTIFSDVPEYGTAIDYAYSMKLILGRGNGVYGYNDPITYQDMLVMAVRALGYETENMSYPYGYIVAAQTLELTEDVDNINFKAELTRGETAQIIWNMLNTEIAFVDPLTNDIVYPGQEDTTPYGLLIAPKTVERTTLLEKAGYADGKLEGWITEFVEKDDKDEDSVDTVELAYTYIKDDQIVSDTVTVAAADLGITEDTPKASYLGLPITVFVDCAAEDFSSDYSTDKDKSDAKVVFSTTESMTTVENLGNAGNIRYVEPTSGNDYFLLGGTKVTLSQKEDADKVVLMTFTKDGWKEERDLSAVQDAFFYKTKGGYEDATNSYGRITYFTYSEPVSIDEDGKTEYEKTTYLCYTPYEFGQYFVRTLKDSTTSKDADFVTIGRYENSAVENQDEVKSYFVEKLVGTETKVTSSTSSVSKKNGEKAKDVTLQGEDIKSGDFMFFDYNEVDNILTVAMNCGAFQTGRLTGTSASAETLKIDGSTKSTGIKGAFDATFFGYDNALAKNIIASLETGKDNVKYIEVDGNVVYFESYSGEKTSDTAYDYIIVTMRDTVIADLLDVKVKDLTKVDGLILDDSDNVQIAVLDTETGEWELASLGRFYNGYDAVEEEWASYSDLGTYATLVDMVGSNETVKYQNYAVAKAAFGQGGIFALVSEKNGVYNLGEIGMTEDGTTDGTVMFNKIDTGLVYSDDSAKTSKISSDPDVDPARVTQNENTIAVVIDAKGNVGVRKGIVKTNNTYNVAGPAYFFSANSSLIVLRTNNEKVSSAKDTALAWAETEVAWTYYLALPGVSSCDLDANETGSDEKYTVTLSNVFNYRSRAMVDSVSFETDDAIEFAADTDLMPTLLFVDKDGIAHDYKKAGVQDHQSASDMNIYVNLSNVDDVATAMLYAWWNTRRSASSSSLGVGADGLSFVDADTVLYNKEAGHPIAGEFDATHYTNLNGTREMAETVNNRVIATLAGRAYTVNATGLDPEEYDFDRALLIRDYKEDDADRWNASYDDEFGGYSFPMNAELIEDISGGPASGIFDQFMLDNDGGVIYIPLADSDDYTDAAKITYRMSIVSIWTDSSSKLELYPMIVYMAAGEADPETCKHLSATLKSTVEATCTTQSTETWTCNICGAEFETHEDNALGHKLTGDITVVTAATCQADGKGTQVCSVCEAVVDVVIPKNPDAHTLEEVTAVAATCTTDGNTAGVRCTVAGCTYTTVETIAKTGHNLQKVDPGKAPTCTEKGLTEKYLCQNAGCSYTEGGEEIAELGHDMQEVAGTAKDATCIEAGKEADKKCSRCDVTETGTEIAIDPDAHSLTGDITETQAPTCTAVGKGTQKCELCSSDVEVEIPMIDHVDEKNNDTQDATHDGKCDVCGGDMPTT